jgi:hypothetical protein
MQRTHGLLLLFLFLFIVARAGVGKQHFEDPYLETPYVVNWLDQANKFWDVRVVDVDMHMPHEFPVVGTLDMDIFPPDNETWNIVSFVLFVAFDRDLNVKSFKDPCHPLSYPIHGSGRQGSTATPVVKRGLIFSGDNIKRLGYSMAPRLLQGNRVFLYAGSIEFKNGHIARDLVIQYIVACEDDNYNSVVADAIARYNVPKPTEYDFAQQTFFNMSLDMANPPALALAFPRPSQHDPEQKSMTERDENVNLHQKQQHQATASTSHDESEERIML